MSWNLPLQNLFRALSILVAAAGFVGCAMAEDDGEEDTRVVDRAMAESGAWQVPAETLAIGDTQHVDYTGGGPWTGSCPGGFTPGASALRDWMYANFPQVEHVGGFACRANTADTSQMSVHGTGRALDLHIALDGGEADNGKGDPVGNFLIEHAEEMGIQYIIWDRLSWGGHRAAGSKTRAYTGPHPHHDHLHIELSVEGGRADTPWFAGPMDPPGEAAPCAVIPTDGAVISESGPCFNAYGPAQYWRHENVGEGGALMWTNAFTSAQPSNWARWSLHFAQPGDYVVEVRSESTFGVFDNARYMVRHEGREDVVFVDQSAIDGWQALGQFHFAAGGSQQVNLYDNVSGAVASDQHITADAVRVTRVVPPSETQPEPEPVVEAPPEPETEPIVEPEPDPDPVVQPDPAGTTPIGDENVDADPASGSGKNSFQDSNGTPVSEDYEPPLDDEAGDDLMMDPDKSVVVGGCSVGGAHVSAGPAGLLGGLLLGLALVFARSRR